MIFIDGQNVYYGSKELSVKIDYKKLVDVLLGDRTLVRAYLYTGQPSKLSEAQYKFHDSLRYKGIEVKPLQLRTKTIFVGEKCPTCKRMLEQDLTYQFEKGIDVYIATDMLNHAHLNGYDTVILVSGDKDFMETIQRVKDRAKKVEIAAFESNIGETKKMADKFISLNSILKQITLTE